MRGIPLLLLLLLFQSGKEGRQLSGDSQREREREREKAVLAQLSISFRSRPANLSFLSSLSSWRGGGGKCEERNFCLPRSLSRQQSSSPPIALKQLSFLLRAFGMSVRELTLSNLNSEFSSPSSSSSSSSSSSLIAPGLYLERNIPLKRFPCSQGHCVERGSLRNPHHHHHPLLFPTTIVQ